MKIRIGFVSNSSTTSFCIFGTYIEDIQELTDKMNENGIETSDAVEYAECQGVDVYHPPYDSNVAYVGFDFSAIPDDVVVKDWKKEKENEMKKIFGDDTINCSVMSDGWHDG